MVSVMSVDPIPDQMEFDLCVRRENSVRGIRIISSAELLYRGGKTTDMTDTTDASGSTGKGSDDAHTRRCHVSRTVVCR